MERSNRNTGKEGIQDTTQRQNSTMHQGIFGSPIANIASQIYRNFLPVYQQNRDEIVQPTDSYWASQFDKDTKSNIASQSSKASPAKSASQSRKASPLNIASPTNRAMGTSSYGTERTPESYMISLQNKKLQANGKVHVKVWKGDWELPSIDKNCLAVMAYLKLSGVSFTQHKTADPSESPKGSLPVLYFENNCYSKVSEIFKLLHIMDWGCDVTLSNKEMADVYAYSIMMEEKLLPALLHLWWIDDRTLATLTRPWYIHAMPFPKSLLYVRQRQKAAEARVWLPQGESATSEAGADKIYEAAKDCLRILNRKLGDNKYMLGEKPSSLDALVFGYLMPLLRAPFPPNPLTSCLQHYDNIYELCSNILKALFRKSEIGGVLTKAPIVTENVLLNPVRHNKLFLTALFAVMAVICYNLAYDVIEMTVSDANPRLNVNQYYLSRPGDRGQSVIDLLEKTKGLLTDQTE